MIFKFILSSSSCKSCQIFIGIGRTEQPWLRDFVFIKSLQLCCAMEKCKDDLEKEFYLKMTKKFGWTKNVLSHQIENQSYEKFLLGQTNFDITLPEELKKYLPTPEEIAARLKAFEL